VNLATGNPDAECLPRYDSALARLDPGVRLYGESVNFPELEAQAAERFARDGIAFDSLTVVSGALDGLERALLAHLRPGDRVIVEDPAFSPVLDLLAALGLKPVPVAVDDSGLLPQPLAEALAQGPTALIATPRAQNPTGAAFDARRVRALRKVLAERPGLLILEDDHASEVSGAAAHTLTRGRERFAVVRSVSKGLGPDLRVALLAGDATTTARVQGRQQLGMGWVSHLLQRLVVELWNEDGMSARLARAERLYAERRQALIDALGEHGIEAHGRSGLNVWVPVPEESEVVAGLIERGWAVSAGERFRIASPPAIRVSTAALAPADARRLASDLAAILSPASRTRAS